MMDIHTALLTMIKLAAQRIEELEKETAQLRSQIINGVAQANDNLVHHNAELKAANKALTEELQQVTAQRDSLQEQLSSCTTKADGLQYRLDHCD